MKHGRFLQSIGLLALGMAASSCNDMMTAGGSDEIDTSVGRVAVDRTGRPVAFARVALVRSGDSTGRALAVSAADGAGSLPDFRVPDGYYGMVLRDPGDTLGRFVDSLEIKSGALPTGRDTLLALGSVQGWVRVAAGHSPATVTLGLIGTDILANVRDDGSFRIELVPGGVYTLGAFPLLEGYGPLYRRIQLRDGQDLILSDTLVMPFTGLAAPGGLRAVQDTATGDVRVSWNHVESPDLYGYFLEALEGGVVVRSLFLLDTAWTDSLGGDWVERPFYGPWADRDVVYRVSSRSKSGVADATSPGVEFLAHPPTWTTRMDSIRLRVDTLPGGRARISWPRMPHPALTGWTIRRRVGSTVDCEAEFDAEDTAWVDSSCPERGWTKIDSGWTSHSGSKGLYQVDTTRWELSAQRATEGRPTAWRLEAVAEAELAPPAGPVFEGTAAGSWIRTSGTSAPQIDRLRGVGAWLVHVVGFPRAWDDEVVSISRDGAAWEDVGKHGVLVGRGDSLWIVHPRSDSMGVVWERRVGAGAWVADSITTPFTVAYVNWAVRDEEGFVFGLQHELLRSVTADYRSVRVGVGSTPWQVLDSSMDQAPAQNVCAMIQASPRGGYDILVDSYYPSGSGSYHAGRIPAMPLYNEGVAAVAMGPSAIVGIWGRFPSSLFWTTPSSDNGGTDVDARLALADSTGRALVVDLPAGAGMPAVRGDELWVPVGNTLWKGTIVTKQ